MSDTQQRTGYTADQPYQAGRREPTAWVGFVLFGGILMFMMGGFQIIGGFVALVRNQSYAVTKNDLVITMDYTAWGWTHLIIGIIALGAGTGILLGQMWARVVGIIIAVISSLANIAFLPAYPVWCAIVIAVDVLVIYALAVHGGEVKERR